MSKQKYPVTAATRWLKQQRVDFIPHLYKYQERGGTTVSARELGVDEHHVIKTLVMEDDGKKPLLVLMHGDRAVSTKSLARILGAKKIAPCAPASANRHSGYLVGGTSPFGCATQMPVYVERTVLELDRIYINGGKRGFLVEIDPAVLTEKLQATAVDAAVVVR